MRQVPDWDSYFMEIAKVVSSRSKDPHTQVGAVLVRNNKIIGTGYNGFAPGVLETPIDWQRPYKYQKVIHAEMNCILHSVKSPKNATLYTTMYPCQECSKLIASAGIKRIVFLDDKYKTASAMELFAACLINVDKLS